MLTAQWDRDLGVNECQGFRRLLVREERRVVTDGELESIERGVIGDISVRRGPASISRFDLVRRWIACGKGIVNRVGHSLSIGRGLGKGNRHCFSARCMSKRERKSSPYWSAPRPIDSDTLKA